MSVYATPSPATMAAYTSMQRPARRTSRWLSRSKRSVSAAKRRLNQPKKPLRSAGWALAMGLSKIGRAACRGRGEISVVGGSFKKKKNKENERVRYIITHENIDLCHAQQHES